MCIHALGRKIKKSNVSSAVAPRHKTITLQMRITMLASSRLKSRVPFSGADMQNKINAGGAVQKSCTLVVFRIDLR